MTDLQSATLIQISGGIYADNHLHDLVGQCCNYSNTFHNKWLNLSAPVWQSNFLKLPPLNIAEMVFIFIFVPL